MANFTKGEWCVYKVSTKEYSFDHEIENIRGYAIYSDKSKYYIAGVRTLDDARLIAAAPDMYNFIRTLYELITNPEDDEEGLSFRFIPEAAKQILDRIDGKED